VAVLTSDNPRFEDPEAIMADVLPGLAGCGEVIALADRRAALARAVNLAGPRDALLVAGKGHETYQQIGEVKRPFSDQETLRELLA
jgi:UDP-N-acetylmuramoyl-L-alanyl-D-glutamate--2,6-diaminopimelate ligase